MAATRFLIYFSKIKVMEREVIRIRKTNKKKNHSPKTARREKTRRNAGKPKRARRNVLSRQPNRLRFSALRMCFERTSVIDEAGRSLIQRENSHHPDPEESKPVKHNRARDCTNENVVPPKETRRIVTKDQSPITV